MITYDTKNDKFKITEECPLCKDVMIDGESLEVTGTCIQSIRSGFEVIKIQEINKERIEIVTGLKVVEDNELKEIRLTRSAISMLGRNL